MKKLLIFVAVIGIFLCANAETAAEKVIRIYNTANEFEKSGNYSEAIKYYIQAYELGETNFAPMKLAEFYALGKGSQENYVESDK